MTYDIVVCGAGPAGSRPGAIDAAAFATERGARRTPADGHGAFRLP
jgi:flavin-dependent dehydrogenase